MAITALAHIRGLPDFPQVIEINVRSGPNTNYALSFKAPVGLSNLPILDVKQDDQKANFQGKVYPWFNLKFPTGMTGWVRGDLLNIWGDLTVWGYGTLPQPTYAFSLTPGVVAEPVQFPTTPPVSVGSSPSVAPVGVPAPVAPVGVAAPAQPVAPAAPAPVVPPAPAPVQPAAPNPLAPPPPAAPNPIAGPAPVQPAAPAPAPVAPPAPEAGPVVPMGYVLMRDGANVRAAPVVSAAAVARLDRNTPVTIMEAKPDQSGLPVKWARVRTQTGVEGWMREDVLRFNAASAQFDLIVPDRYPASMIERWWVRGYEGPAPGQHWGWDWGAKVGEPVLCGPNGGTVLKSVACTKCTAQKPSFKDYGIPLGDLGNLNDPAWNFGYGHYVIVRYLNNQLPASTQQALARIGLNGAHLFAMHGHLNSRSVTDKQELAPNQAIGTCGDTGNSQAAHLHLEIRASLNANDINWAGMKKNLLDPTILYQR